MDSKCTPSTDLMQGIGNIVQAGISLLTLAGTLLVAWFAYRVSQGQICPLLSLDIENGRRYTQIKLQNNGLGPAMIDKVTYRLRGQRARVDSKEMDLNDPETLKKVVKACVTVDGRPTGSRTYLFRHKEVDPGAELKELLDSNSHGGNKEEGMVAGQVLKATGDIVLLRAVVKEEPPGVDNGPAKAWLQLLRRMVNGAVVEVEYTDARGVKMDKYIGVITMPAQQAAAASPAAGDAAAATAAAAAGAAAAVAAGAAEAAAAGGPTDTAGERDQRGRAGMAAISSPGAARGSSSKAASAADKDSVVLQVSVAVPKQDIRDAAAKVFPK